MRFSVKNFNRLSSKHLYAIYYLRAKVFVVEQNCPYQDVDEKDLKAHHILLTNKGHLIAYARILPPGVSYKQAAIGRVVVHPDWRGKKIGEQLMKKAMTVCHKLYPEQVIVISAQSYLLKFYSDLGFKQVGKGYLEDNIPHVKMELIPC